MVETNSAEILNRLGTELISRVSYKMASGFRWKKEKEEKSKNISSKWVKNKKKSKTKLYPQEIIIMWNYGREVKTQNSEQE